MEFCNVSLLTNNAINSRKGSNYSKILQDGENKFENAYN